MRRVCVVGNSGSGKTTLARELAGAHGLTHIELDDLMHGPGWTPTPAAAFRSRLSTAMADADRATDGWTMCGNYQTHSDWMGQKAADTIVWLDLPRWLVMKRVTFRTVRRAVKREVLWNGNREPLTNFYRWDPEQNVIRWAWTRYDEYRQQGLDAMTDGTWAHATVHRLCSPTEVAHFKAATT